jgi:SET domain-containing protein
MPPALNSSTVVETALVCFRPSTIHGTGGFAKADIAVGAHVIEYVGEKITKAESLRRCESNNEYIFSLSDEFDLDGNVPWNPARFLNHSCDPNCEAEPEGGRVWIVARRGIRTGEEITFNYGYDLEDYREHPCRCGAADCAGYIVAAEYHEHVRWQGGLSRRT